MSVRAFFRAQVRVPLGRRADREEADQVFGAEVHRLPHDVGSRSARRRVIVSKQNR